MSKTVEAEVTKHSVSNSTPRRRETWEIWEWTKEVWIYRGKFNHGDEAVQYVQQTPGEYRIVHTVLE